MTLSEFYKLIDEVIEAPAGTIQGGEILESLSGWDSLAVLALIAAVDERCEIALPAKLIANCKTVDDLAALLGDKIEKE